MALDSLLCPLEKQCINHAFITYIYNQWVSKKVSPQSKIDIKGRY